MQNYSTKYIFKPKTLLLSSLAVVLAYGIVNFPSSASAMTNSHMKEDNKSQRYVANIDPLNKSNVDGTAEFVQKGNRLAVTINATGLEPGVHPQHIHGQKEAAAECPTDSADVNNDGFVSVLEGAPAYGPIKLNLTSPQTAFGTPPTPALFTAFAGTPDNKNFPTAGADGKLHFVQTYTFDNSDAAQGAFKSLTPLDAQHVVLHGGTAPLGVDATAFAALGSPRPEGFNPNELSYDALLPVGCGQIDEVFKKDHSNNAPIGNTNVDKGAHLNGELVSAKTQLNNGLGMATMHVNTTAFTTLSDQLANEFDMLTQNAISTYRTSVAGGINADEARNQLINGLASSKDHQINKLNEARNQLIDQLNRNGNVVERDHFLSNFDKSVDSYSNAIEKAKNQLQTFSPEINKGPQLAGLYLYDCAYESEVDKIIISVSSKSESDAYRLYHQFSEVTCILGDDYVFIADGRCTKQIVYTFFLRYIHETRSI